jgi:uncharacterized protein
VKLSVHQLSETPTAQVFAVTPAWCRASAGVGTELAEAIVEALEFRVEAHRMGADLLLQGEVRGQLELSCGRCLERYRAPLQERFRLVLEPAGHRVPADPEGAAALARDGLFLSDELETGWFRGDEIDLSSFIHEVIALLIPVQPLCREDCLGLCPRCGIDRNTESCDCVEKNPASPFAVLEALRGGASGGGNS